MNRSLLILAVLIGIAVSLPVDHTKEQVEEEKKHLFKLLDNLKDEVNTAIVGFRAQSQNYYVARLGLILDQLEEYRISLKNIKSFGEVRVYESFLYGSIWHNTKLDILSPAPEELLKGQALYLSAIIAAESHAHSTKLTPKAVQDKVKAVIQKENAIVAPNLALKVQGMDLDNGVQDARQALKSMLAHAQLPDFGQFEKLEQEAQKKVIELTHEEAAKWQSKLDAFIGLRMLLNSLAPIDGPVVKLGQYIATAEKHHEAVKVFQEFVGKR